MTEVIICPIHNKPLRWGKWGASCPTPIEKDENGSVTKWCQFKPEKDTKATQVETREPIPQRDYEAENTGKCRHGIVVALIEHGGSEALKAIANNADIREQINKVAKFSMTGDEF